MAYLPFNYFGRYFQPLGALTPVTAVSKWQTLSVNQQATAGYGTNYPFVGDPGVAKYALGDLWLAYPDDADTLQLPLRVAFMSGFGAGVVASPTFDYSPSPVHDQDMVIVDNTNQVVFNTATATSFIQRNWGNNLETLQWISGEFTLRVTRHLAAPPWKPANVLLQYIYPVAAYLDSRTYFKLPQRVRSLRVGLVQVAGTVEFKEGYNIQLTPSATTRTDGRRLVNRIEMQAQPGDGLGRVPGCEDDDPPIRRINTIGATAGGDFTLDAQGCYRLQRPAALVGTNPRRVALGGAAYAADFAATIDAISAGVMSGNGKIEQEAFKLQMLTHPADYELSALQLFNDCGPCCECDDFVRTYTGLRRLFLQYVSLGQRAEKVRDDLGTAIDRWEAQRLCRAFQNLKLLVQPGPNGDLFIGGMHCNMTQCCVPNVTLRLTIESFASGAPVDLTAGLVMQSQSQGQSGVALNCPSIRRAGADTGYAEQPFVPAGTWPVYDINFDYEDPQGTSRFYMRFKLTGTTDEDVLRVTLSAHADQVPDPNSGITCPLPASPAVPAAVSALWVGAAVIAPIRSLVTRSVPIGPSVGCGVCND